MITINLSDVPESIRTHGATDAQLQSSWRLVATAAGERIVLEWEGPEGAVMDLAGDDAAQFGSTELPDSSGLSASADHGIILDARELSGSDAAHARFHAEFRARNERETDEDVRKGLQSRDIGAQWIERQELIEHFMARCKSESGAFNAPLFQAWLSEADPAARMAYQITAADGSLVSLDDEGADGSKLTLGAAQRYAMGVQYAARQMMQVVVDETWRVPPDIDAACNVILDEGIPEKHRPLFDIANWDGKFTWMRARDEVKPAGPLFYRRRVAYFGVPNAMAPVDPPEGWGDGPIDELLYGGDKK